MRKGIAFFSSILIMTLVMMLVAIALSYVKDIKLSEAAEREKVIENIYFNDVYNFLIKNMKLVTGGKNPIEKRLILSMLFKTPIRIEDPVNNRILTIELRSNDGKININQISDFDFRINYLDPFLESIEMGDKELFKELIMINSGKESNITKNGADMDLSLVDYDFQKGDIRDFKTFYKILTRYVEISQDTEILSLDWESIIRFEGRGFDLNFAPKALIDPLPITLDEGTKEELSLHTKIYHSFEEIGV